MILYIIIGFLAVSLVLYCLFGGADFGAGILGLFISRSDGRDISDVIGPVWEANHVWLILAVTILFVGFPTIYAAITTYLHIPILLLLIGIIMRGTAFAFMHYDAIKGPSTRVYQWVFNISSVLTPLFLGITAGALMLGRIDPTGHTFYEVFMASWMNGFSFTVGLFCISLFAFLAAVFMIGEAETDRERVIFVKAAKITQLSTVIIGGIVFAAARWYGLPLIHWFLDSWIAITCIALATISLAGIWRALNTRMVWTSRLIAGGQVFLILVAWFWVRHPVAVHLATEQDLTFFNSAASEPTLMQLLIALLVGSCLILPGLFILFRTFKSKLPSTVQEQS